MTDTLTCLATRKIEHWLADARRMAPPKHAVATALLKCLEERLEEGRPLVSVSDFYAATPEGMRDGFDDLIDEMLKERVLIHATVSDGRAVMRGDAIERLANDPELRARMLATFEALGAA